MKLQSLNEEKMMNDDELAKFIIRISKDKKVISHVNNLAGGYGDKITLPEAIDKFGVEALVKGLKVELEHTDNALIALEIAIDHLVENKKYYDYLEKMEKEMKSDENKEVE